MGIGEKRSLDILKLMVSIEDYLCFERIVGMGLLIYAIVIAFNPLIKSTSLEYLIEKTGINSVIFSTWFLFSSMYLLIKAEKISLTMLVLCLFPILLQVIADLLYGAEILDGTYMARELFLLLFIGVNLIKRIFKDILEQADVISIINK